MYTGIYIDKFSQIFAPLYFIFAAARNKSNITEYYGTRSFSFVIFRTDALQNTCIDTLAVFALLFVNKCAALSVLRASFSLLLPRSSPSQND